MKMEESIIPMKLNISIKENGTVKYTEVYYRHKRGAIAVSVYETVK